ncbi:MAG: hypothetical protein EOP46_02705 [Sphingobacteriaceae bacterium]|nr:MAG: hypothetical protein EOP46_02705 [Sphingobacteriaceae bacterium]
MPKLSRSLTGLCAFAAVLFFSCTEPDTDKDGIANDADDCPEVFAKTKNGCPVKKEVKNVHLYIETSVSMGGYFNNQTEFKTVVTDLASKVNGEIKPVDIWFVSTQPVKYNGTVESFTKDIAITTIADKKSSELHKIFAEVAKRTATDDVSFLVSDCILSFSNEEIKNNPEINKTEANNSMRQSIYSTFLKLKNNKQAVGVYAFKSNFYGVYYDYQNVKTEIKGNKRPYYIWVIANKDILKNFIDRFTQISTFEPEQSLYFGLTEEPVKQYGVLTQVEKAGEWSVDNKTEIVDAEIPKDDSLKFCIGVNLENLPAYARNVTYLQKNLQITADGCTANFMVKTKSAQDPEKIKGPQQNKLFKKSSHLLVISVTKMNMNDAVVNLKLPLKYDMWYENWSTDDDKDMKFSGNPSKTFAFKYLINGVKEAYETREKNYIDISIPVSK